MPKVLFAGLLATGMILSLHAQIPSQKYISFLGGGGGNYQDDQGFSITVDTDGFAYVAGQTTSDAFPATKRLGDGLYGSFIAKVNPTGTELVYCTFLGGIEAHGIVINNARSPIIIAKTGVDSLPYITAGTYKGGYTDGVVLKLSPDGSNVEFARYIGGSDLELPLAITRDSQDNLYVTGHTTSTDFFTSESAVRKQLAGGFDAFVMKLNQAGDILYSTYLGGAGIESSTSIAVDANFRAYITGYTLSQNFAGAPSFQRLSPGGFSDGYVARLNADGSTIDFVSVFGGSVTEAPAAIALGQDGSIHVFGQTESDDFPAQTSPIQSTRIGGTEHFLAKLSPNGDQLVFATYLGGGGTEDLLDYHYVGRYFLDGVQQPESAVFTESAGLEVESNGTIHIAARTGSFLFGASFPNPVSFGDNYDAYYAKVNSTGTLLLDFQFFGGRGYDLFRDLALDANGNVYFSGGSELPVRPPHFGATPGAFQQAYGGNVNDAIVIKLSAVPQVPAANDNFSQAATLAGNRPGAMGNTLGATRETGEPADLQGAGRTLWYSWQAPFTGKVRASTRGSGTDTLLAAYSGTQLNNLSLLATNDDEGNERTTSQIEFSITSGQRYYFVIDTKTPDPAIVRLSLIPSGQVNDDISNARELTGLPVSITGSNVGASYEELEPNHAGFSSSQSVWFKWTPSSTINVVITTAASTFNTLLAVYTQSNGQLTEIKSNDNNGNTTLSEVAFKADAGVTYYIVVDAPYDYTGNYQLSILPNEPPANDNFASAAEITGSVANFTATNIRCTREPNEPELTFSDAFGNIDRNFSGNSVWWKWTAPATGRVRLNTRGSSFDTRLGVYTGTALDNLQLVASNNHIDVNNLILTSEVEFPAQGGTTFYFMVDGSTSDPSGAIQMSLRLSFPPRLLSQTLQRVNGNLRFSVVGVQDQHYAFQTSTDLINWSAPSGDFTGPNFEVTVPITSPHLFVRLTEISQPQ